MYREGYHISHTLCANGDPYAARAKMPGNDLHKEPPWLPITEQTFLFILLKGHYLNYFREFHILLMFTNIDISDFR